MTLTDAAPMATAPEPDEPADSYANLVDAVAGLVRFAALRPDPDGHRMSEVVIPSRDEIEAHLLQREAEHPWWEPVAVLGLTATELLVLLVAVAAEVSLDVERECERLTAGRASWTSLGLAMGLLADDARGARQVRELCEPGGLLVGHGIVELHADERRRA